MALQVWLPLNGTLENKGLANIKMTGTPAYSNGKIGKCVEFNATTTNIIHDSNVCPDLKYIDNFSFCLWVNNKRTSDDTAIQYVFTAGRADGTTYGYGIELRNPNFYIRFGSSSYNVTGTLNTWTHLAFTKQGTTIKIYKNGSLYSTNTFSGTLPEYTQYTGIGIGCFHYSSTNIYPSRCQVNDFRIYDHALSPKEVKEISKGLILHYKLDGNDIGITIPRNGGLIPDGVELYDYILGTGTLYIDSGLPMNRNTTIDYTILMVDNTSLQRMIGHLTTNLYLLTYVGDGTSNIKTYKTLSSSGSYLVMIAYNVNKHNYILNEYGTHKIYVDGTYKDVYTLLPSSDTYYGNCYIFWANGANSSSHSKGKCKIYDCKLYDEGVLKRNLLPCTYLGEPGMWDTVENKFYRNQGTGLFTLGNKITLKEYEYLEATGTQYINTDYIPKNTSGIYLKAYCTTSGGNHLIIGCRQTSGDTRWWINYSTALELSWNLWTATLTGYTNTWTEIEHNYMNSRSAKVNGTSYSVNYPTLANITYPAYLFNSCNQGNLGSGFIGRISNAKITEGTNIVRNFLPCTYLGEPGMWDTVEWKFYANAGSGSFTLGPEKTVQQDAPIFYDSSGYCNHGSITGTLTTNNDTPRYTNSLTFNGSSRITSNDINLPGTSLFTISCWVYRTGSQNYWPTFWLGNGTTSLGIAMHGSAIDRIQGGNGTNSFNNTGSTGISANTWTHLVLVYNGSNVIEYLNGSQVNSIAYSYGFGSTLVRMYVGYFWGSDWGISFTGRLSDVRLYATALSEDDVKELYNTSAFVTNNGVFAEYELYEDNLSDVKKRGLLETANFYENGAESGYALDTDKTRVASNYIISEDFIEI